ncbi:MAG: 4Fe-4S dicluster domain-containing protein [Slackia sp.]|nr:4Fe-4S dicluster domain-containing protein [Slackia sp.]
MFVLEGDMVARGFFFDNERCTGCRTCMMACADYHDLPQGHVYRRVIDYEGGSCEAAADGCALSTAYAYHISLACNHCEHPECVHVCPTGAMHKNDLGFVCVDAEKCIGCGYCTVACPYHAPSIDDFTRQSSKCDGCTDRVAQGEQPICVQACPLRALFAGDADAMKGLCEDASCDIMPLPDSSYTRPNLYMCLSPAARDAVDGRGFIANPLEIGQTRAV